VKTIDRDENDKNAIQRAQPEKFSVERKIIQVAVRSPV